MSIWQAAPRRNGLTAAGGFRDNPGASRLKWRVEMRARFLAAGLLTLGWGAGLFAQAGSTAAVEKTLIANENKINDAVTKHDVKTFNDLVASDALSADGSGFMKSGEFAKSMDQIKITFSHLMNPQVLWVNDKTAVVAYTWMGSGTFKGQPIPEQTFASTVWTDRNGKWVAVFHQETPVTPPPPAPAKKK
jgi:hypothetical protein